MESEVYNLPSEIWRDIFSCLSDPADLARCRRVCKLFHALITHCDEVWGEAAFATWGIVRPNHAFQKIYPRSLMQRTMANGNWHCTELPKYRYELGHSIDILPFSGRKGDWVVITTPREYFGRFPLFYRGSQKVSHRKPMQLHQGWGPNQKVLHVALLPVEGQARNFVALCITCEGAYQGQRVWEGWSATERTDWRDLGGLFSTWLRLDLAHLGECDQLMVGTEDGVVELWKATPDEVTHRILFRFDHPLRLLYTTPESPDLVAGVVGQNRIMVWRISEGYRTVLDYEVEGQQRVASLTFLSDHTKNRLFLFMAFPERVELLLFDSERAEGTEIFQRALYNGTHVRHGRLWQTGENQIYLMFDIGVRNLRGCHINFSPGEGGTSQSAFKSFDCTTKAILPQLDAKGDPLCWDPQGRSDDPDHPSIVHNFRNQLMVANVGIMGKYSIVVEHNKVPEGTSRICRWFSRKREAVIRTVPPYRCRLGEM